ncbi:MAG: hypothetical protein F4X82_01210 [Candidatus Spechtbacteria bacterium SB0662_bin_43]|uniref:Uncharacterized protein n=1 Tax=Candidatus Spechtbacteria bacterium SB0662_bin_43 TaxID=2604897 RepID=A0A845DLC7_9BACT|nr:hypothetical protein [Candidatus Spechtbacteria bacterium SB0662_bin_43]
MTAKSKKRQLEKAKQRNNKASREAFFDKLKTTGHEPLPDPTKFRIGNVLKPLFLLGVLALVLFFGYQSLVDSDSGSIGSQDNSGNTNTAVVPDDTQTQDDKDNTSNNDNISSDTGDFSVAIRSSIAISEPTTISYGLPSSLSAAEVALLDSELHLVDKDGAYIGYITDLPLSDTSFEWNPQVVYQEKGSEVIQAPQQGLYHLMIALRPNDQAETPLSELEQTTISNTFDIEYDESVEESPFRCFSLREYNQIRGYSSIVNLLEERGFTVSGQETACYSPDQSPGESSPDQAVMIVLMNERSERGYPLIFRFVIKKYSEDDRTEVGAAQAVYAIPRDQELTINSLSVGRRQGAIVPLVVNGWSLFNYNFVTNVITAVAG